MPTSLFIIEVLIRFSVSTKLFAKWNILVGNILFASLAAHHAIVLYMTSIVLIESSCSPNDTMLARWKNAVYYFPWVFSSLRRFIFQSISRKNTANCRKKNFLAIIMLRSTNRSSTSRRRYLEKSSNGNAKWTFARHGTKCVRPRNSFPSTYSFLFESTFISPFYKRENWIRSSRKVSYKIIGRRKPREIYNRTNRMHFRSLTSFAKEKKILLSCFELKKSNLIILC